MGVTILEGGKDAFKEIINCIRNAEKTIEIHMFIWRDDHIGNIMGREVLKAADRGIRIYIYKDKKGGIFEKAEESKQSFFHKERCLIQDVQSFFMDIAYPAPKKAKTRRQRKNVLAEQIIAHPNILIEKDEIVGDHSKYYIFDDKILILGGINIEDKEVFKDARDMVYHDYMVKIDNSFETAYFRKRMRGDASYNAVRPIDYFMNHEVGGERVFHIREHYTELILCAKHRIRVEMPYLGDAALLELLQKQASKGVRVEIIIPGNANIQQNLNMKCVQKILEKDEENLSIYLSPKMTHGKMVIVDDMVATVGSANFNRLALEALYELNVVFGSGQKETVDELILSYERHKKISVKCENDDRVFYHLFLAWIEGKV